MNIDKTDHSANVVAVGELARKLQKASASPNNTKQVYELATTIMLECQHIRETLGQDAQPRTIMDYVKRVLNGKN